MDPFSAEGELVNIHSAFHQGQFQSVVDTDTSKFASTNTLAAQVLKFRARIALGEQAAVISELDKTVSLSPDLLAVKALAQFSKPNDASAHQAGSAAADTLTESHSDNLTVQLLCGSILTQQPGREQEALNLLAQHTGSLDAVALVAQLHLQLNRPDLAAQQVAAARSWAQDSLLVNLAEAWVGLRQGGREKYQAAFYVYEELATAIGTTSTRMHVGQAVAELLLGRLPEAEAAMEQAKQTGAEDGDVLANDVVLRTILGRDSSEARAALARVQPQHTLLVDLAKKQEAFTAAMGKYTPILAAET